MKYDALSESSLFDRPQDILMLNHRFPAPLWVRHRQALALGQDGAVPFVEIRKDAISGTGHDELVKVEIALRTNNPIGIPDRALESLRGSRATRRARRA